jgi:replication initiation and membrane attachment protein DnaB
MSVKRTAILLRLRPEDREVIRQLAKYYDIAEADVVKILIREYMKNHKIDVGSSSP